MHHYIDLHTHSTASDGSEPPAHLAALAQKAGITAFALTDHDTVDGVPAACAAAEALGLECIAGCEIAVPAPVGELHIVGLWVPLHCSEFLRELDEEKYNRLERNLAILERLQALGMDITMEDVQRLAHGPTLGRPHIARALVAKGFATDTRDAFVRFLGNAGAAFVPRALRSAEAGIHFLAGSGATPVWAHPCLAPNDGPDFIEQTIRQFKEYGLQGIEAFHSAHTPRQVRLCLKLAQKYGLLVSGGSDFHGKARPQAVLGYSQGHQRISGYFLEQIIKARLESGLPV